MWLLLSRCQPASLQAYREAKLTCDLMSDMTETDENALSRSPDEQASGFEAVRTAHQSEMIEDYVELIAELIHLNGAARPVEIAERPRSPRT